MSTIDPPELRIWLNPAAEDHQQPLEAYQAEIKQLQKSANARGVTLELFRPKTGQAFDHSVLDAMGQFVVAHLGEAAPILTGLLGTWLGARNGRKVRLKIGDVEVEGRTAEEVEKLLDKAKEIQERNQPKKIYEP